MTPFEKPPFQLWLRRSPVGRDRFSIRLQAVAGRWCLMLDPGQVLQGTDAHAEGLSAAQLRVAQIVPSEGAGTAYALSTVSDTMLLGVGVREWVALGIAQLGPVETAQVAASIASQKAAEHDTPPVVVHRERTGERASRKAGTGGGSKSFTIVEDSDDEDRALQAPTPRSLQDTPPDPAPLEAPQPPGKPLHEREAEFVRRHAPGLASDFDAPSGPIELKQNRVVQDGLTWPDAPRPAPKRSEPARDHRGSPALKPVAAPKPPEAPQTAATPKPAAAPRPAAAPKPPEAPQAASASRFAAARQAATVAIPSPPLPVDPPATLRALRRQARRFDIERAVLEARVAELEAALARTPRSSHS